MSDLDKLHADYLKNTYIHSTGNYSMILLNTHSRFLVSLSCSLKSVVNLVSGCSMAK